MVLLDQLGCHSQIDFAGTLVVLEVVVVALIEGFC